VSGTCGTRADAHVRSCAVKQRGEVEEVAREVAAGSVAGGVVAVSGVARHLHLPVSPTSFSTSFSSAGILSLEPAALKAAA